MKKDLNPQSPLLPISPIFFTCSSLFSKTLPSLPLLRLCLRVLRGRDERVLKKRNEKMEEI